MDLQAWCYAGFLQVGEAHTDNAFEAFNGRFRVELPWSTSATSLILVLFIPVLVATLRPSAVLREMATLAGGLPVLLWAFAIVGMLWADMSWAERLQGLMRSTNWL
jgi:hypothetical protein